MSNFLFLVGAALVIFGVNYGLWAKVRVIRLRQDIFDKRDELFDIADSLNAFDDPGYRAARQHLNSLAHLARDISIPFIYFVTSIDGPPPTPITSPIPALQTAIDNVFEWSGKRIVEYLLQETIRGRLLTCILGAMSFQTKLRDRTQPRIEYWVRSDAPVRLDSLRSQPRAGMRHVAQALKSAAASR